MQGGLAQGIGQALYEHTVYDPDSGQMLSGSFMDYHVPRAADLPDLDVTLTGVPTTANPLGVKGSGQAGAIAAPQTIISAILNALSPLGVTHIDMPATPQRIWQAIQTARNTMTRYRRRRLSGSPRRAWRRVSVRQPRNGFRPDRGSLQPRRARQPPGPKANGHPA